MIWLCPKIGNLHGNGINGNFKFGKLWEGIVFNVRGCPMFRPASSGFLTQDCSRCSTIFEQKWPTDAWFFLSKCAAWEFVSQSTPSSQMMGNIWINNCVFTYVFTTFGYGSNLYLYIYNYRYIVAVISPKLMVNSGKPTNGGPIGTAMAWDPFLAVHAEGKMVRHRRAWDKVCINVVLTDIPCLSWRDQESGIRKAKKKWWSHRNGASHINPLYELCINMY